ncbi:glycine-rich domain-containing protein [Massilia niabensis]|uniref:Glycine-rich domain-containing protein n=1 Tax=Massilia niabensis TaxID=544910 RepID=A0ABW0LCC4_9BURK
MISNNNFARIAALDLNPIKVKLMHKESGEGWSPEHANAIENEYRRFLYLMTTFPNVQMAPRVDVDTFWHYHILDTMKYARDCEQAFGYFVHHYPYLGLMGEDDKEMQQQAGERMRELYESTFGLSYVRPLRTDGAMEAADVQTACAPTMSQAANSAYCIGVGTGPGILKAADVQAAYCIGVGTGPAMPKAADVQTAYCIGVGTGPGMFKAADVQTAYCIGVGTGPGMFKAADVQTAYCIGVGTGPGMLKAADVQTAYCIGVGTGPGMLKAADVQTAYCIGVGTGPGKAVPQAA